MLLRITLGVIVLIQAVLIATPGVSIAAAPAPLAGAFKQQGLELGQVIDDAGQIRFTDAVAGRIVESGARWVHINFRLGGFQDWTETTTFGVSALSRYDEIVATAERHGLGVVGLLSNETWHGFPSEWQSQNAESAGGSGDNAYLAAFSRQAAVVLAGHFAGRVDRWEIWNEPNADVTYLYPSNFAWLLARVYTDVKAAGVSSARFISGGLSSVQDEGDAVTGESTGADYLRQIYAQGRALAGWETIRSATGSFPLDAIGQHLYLDGYRRTDHASVRAALALVRDAYVEGEGGDGTKQTIITEVGWSSANVTERVQADNLQIAFAVVMETAYVETASWFFLRDEPASGLAFGLRRSDDSEKPAWHAYRVVTTPEAPPLPVVGLTATGLPTGIHLAWQTNYAPDLAGYQLYRSSALDGPFEHRTTLPIETTTYLDVGAPTDVPLSYRVAAVDTGGNVSALSDPRGGLRASEPTLVPFARVWARTDQPVAELHVDRTWMWGSAPLGGVMTERYLESTWGFRQVQYFDKSRMELTHPEMETDSLWSVTNGLLVVELMTGRLQLGDALFEWRRPADVNVAGDPGSGPTYAAMNRLRDEPAAKEGTLITQRLDADGRVTNEPELAGRGVTAARIVAETGHTVASPFWAFMNGSGLVNVDGREIADRLFEQPFYATGLPITEAYWTTVALDGVATEVLAQCFERRCLTYTPDNPAGWQVEAGNVGRHYYLWRYGDTLD